MNKVLIGSGSAEITEKKSRFIATAYEVHTEEEALAQLEQLRKQYWDARHNCYAYVIGKNSELTRFSDDKEPQGTAGKPILNVLTGAGLKNTLIVVTRYFGGILLGTGGLVRAYTGASAKVVEELTAAGKILEVQDGLRVSFTCEYKHIGRIENLFSGPEIYALKKEYGEKAVYEAAVPAGSLNTFSKSLLDATDGQSALQILEEITFCTAPGGALLYNF